MFKLSGRRRNHQTGVGPGDIDKEDNLNEANGTKAYAKSLLNYETGHRQKKKSVIPMLNLIALKQDLDVEQGCKSVVVDRQRTIRSHRNMSFAQKVEADMADSSGIAPRESVEFMSRQVGGRQNLGFIYDDYKNYLHSKRTREIKLVDEDDLITNIFWADSRMMVDYDYFGNVAMSGKKPKTILTDQDAAMAKALFEKWPQTCHRLCIWHIYQNAAKQLKNVFENFNDFTKEFSSCIYDHEDEDDFLYVWNNML
ncbi:hypothetical protein COP2_019532 [Malus domestica]